MDFRVLGPLEVVQGARPVDLGRPKQRALLGLLLLRAGQAVSVDRVMEELWRGRPPRQALASLHAYVSNLRRVIEPDRAPGDPPRVLVRRAGGYVMQVEPSRLDAARFEGGVSRARAAVKQGEHESGHRLFEAALAEWRGDPLADLVDELDLVPEIPRLVELRMAALEESFESALALGCHAEVVADLEALVREHPLRERLRGHLALALYRTGRQAEALDRIRDGRQLLAHELGLDATPALRELEQAILRHAPEVRWTAPPESVGLLKRHAPRASRALVGRDAEVAALAEAWGETTEGRGSIALVTGEPGIGKTQLAEELASQVTATAGRVHWGRSFEGGGAPAFWLWLQILDAAVADLDDEALSTVGGAQLAELARLAPAVSERLGVEPLPVIDAAEARFRLYDAVTRFLLKIASARPVALVLDDIHWADAPSLELLRFLAGHIKNAPLLVIATYRDSGGDRAPLLDETLATLTRQAPLIRVPLAGLTLDDVSSLLERHRGARPPEALARRLHERTDGNPFYLSELIRLISPDPETWGQTPALDAMPTGVRDVIEHRLVALPSEVVAALEVAAVIGRDFDIATVAHAQHVSASEILESLDAAVAARVVVEQDASASAYRFTHALVRETLYARLRPSRRARLHARVAEAIEATSGDSRISELAFHYEHAAALGLAERAVEAALAASDTARKLLAYEQSKEHLRRALRVLERFGDLTERELIVQARLTALLLETEGYSAPGLAIAAARVRELAARAGQVPEVAGVLWALWSYRSVRAEFDAALKAADELADARSVAPREVVDAAALHARGVTYWHLGRIEESAQLLEAAIEALDGIDAKELERAGLDHLPIYARLQTSHPFALLGRADDAEPYVLAAAAYRDRERDPYNHASALMFIGWLGALRSDFSSAVEWLEEAARITDEYGFRQLAAINGAPLGWAQAMSGHPKTGIATVEAAMAAMDATGAKMLRHWHLGILAEALLAAGRADDALAAAEQGLKVSAQTGEAFHRAELLRLRGQLLLERGARDAARADLEDAIAIAQRQGAVVLVERAQATLAAV